MNETELHLRSVVTCAVNKTKPLDIAGISPQKIDGDAVKRIIENVIKDVNHAFILEQRHEMDWSKIPNIGSQR